MTPSATTPGSWTAVNWRASWISGAPLEVPAKFYYLTCHRQENTDTDENLRGYF